MGGWVQKIAIFAYVQCINDVYIVGGSENVQKPAYVIFEWSLRMDVPLARAMLGLY